MPISARSVSHTAGVDRVRALQRVLYRCAKQDRDRRFHALCMTRSPAATSWSRRGARSVLTVGRPASMGDHRRRRALRGRRLPRRARRAAAGRDVPAAAAAAGSHPQAGQARSVAAARYSLRGRPGGDGGGEDRARADLRSRLPPDQLRVSARAVGPPCPGDRQDDGQPGQGLGARRRHPKLLSTRSRRTPCSLRSSGGCAIGGC